MKEKDFTILYVDDEENNLFSFKAAFRRDYNILTAISGEEGIELLRNNPVNLIITDQRMPGMTGIEFLENVIPEYPDVIRMILTGFSDVEAIINAINTGRVYRYITKPWDENELRMTIENARQLWNLQQKNKELMHNLQQKVKDQERTLQLFVKYVPQPVIEKALESTEETIFDGEQRYVTVLFCDIRGFTNFSDSVPPKNVVSLLNEYYSSMTQVINKFDGSVIQYVGDEIFAAFGAPIATELCEEKAVRCALEMRNQLNILNEKYKDKFNWEVRVGIGINSGEVIAGNLGSDDKINYAITGDTVNTGKRIESITKDEINRILISNSVFEKVKDKFEMKSLPEIELKGKRNKITVYEVLDYKK